MRHDNALMISANAILGLFALIFCSCENAVPTKPHLHPKHAGIYIDHGTMTGNWHNNGPGNIYSYRSITSTIINDSTLPLHLDLALPAEQPYPAPYNDQRYRLFIIPEALAAQQYNADSKALKDFLDSASGRPCTLQRIIQPKEELSLTIGVFSSNKGVAPGQMALLSKGHKPHFPAHDSLINEALSKTKVLELLFALDFYKPLNNIQIIPCGKMWYAK